MGRRFFAILFCLLFVTGFAISSQAEMTEYHVEKIKAFRISIRSTDVVGTLNRLQNERAYTGTLIKAEITAYCACKKCNGNYSSGNETETASGIILRNEPEYADKYCAATAAVGDLGDIVIIDGVQYEIVDRMGRKHGKAIDIFVPNHKACYEEYGRRRSYEVEVIER